MQVIVTWNHLQDSDFYDYDLSFLAEFGRLRIAHVAGTRETTPGTAERQQSTPLSHPYALRSGQPWHPAKERKVSTFLRVHS